MIENRILNNLVKSSFFLAALFLTISTSITSALFPLLALIGIYTIIYQQKKIHSSNKSIFVTILLLTLFIINSFNSPANFNIILRSILKMARLLYIPILVILLQSTKQNTRFYLNTCMLAISVAVLLGIIQFFNIFSLDKYLSHANAHGVFKDKIFTNVFSSFLAYYLFSLAISINTNKFKKILLYVGAIIASLYVLLLNTSNTGHIIFVALTLLSLILNIKKLTVKQHILTITVIFITFFLAFITNSGIKSRTIISTKQAINFFQTNLQKFQTKIKINTTNEVNTKKINTNDKFKNVNKVNTTNEANTKNKNISTNTLNTPTQNIINTEKNSSDYKFTQVDKDSSVGLRLKWSLDSLELFKEKPYLGHGTGSFTYEHKQLSTKINTVPTTNPHNQYLLIMVEHGLLGLLLLLSFFIILIKESFKLAFFEKRIAIGIITTIMIGSLANSWLNDFTTMHFFVFIISMCLCSNFQKH